MSRVQAALRATNVDYGTPWAQSRVQAALRATNVDYRTPWAQSRRVAEPENWCLCHPSWPVTLIAVLPSRSRLTRWTPDELHSTIAAVDSAGDRVQHALEAISTNLKAMPELRAWEGRAHDAASEMFDRAHLRARRFNDYVTDVSQILRDAADLIGTTRNALLNKADEVDLGELYVTDQWVVLIRPAPMSAEKVEALMERVISEQASINELLMAVGAADDATAEKLCAAAQSHGASAPPVSGTGSLILPGTRRPQDEVPNPAHPLGLLQQSVMRGEDMAMTVRDTGEEIVNGDEYRKTLFMQDGSKHVTWEYGSPEYPMASVTHYDANGDVISTTLSWKTIDDVRHTEIEWADGTVFKATETPEGIRTAGFTLPDGRHGVLPPDNPFFTGPVPTAIGSALTGLDAHIGRGGRLPMLSVDAIENVGKGAKFGGPALSILSTIYSMGAAETAYDRCVTGFAGGFKVVGEVGGATGGGLVGLTIPVGQAVLVPGFAVGGSMLAAEWMQSLGTRVGEQFCR